MFQFILPFSFLLTITNPYTLNTFNADIYQAYITDDLELWEQTLERGAGTFTMEDTEAIYRLSLAYYGIVGSYLGKEMDDKAELHLQFVEELVENALELHIQSSRFHALRGALLAFEINLNSYKAMFLGPKSQTFIEKSVELDSSNPQAWVEYGNMLYYMPTMFGGDKQEGIEAYQKAITLFEKKNDLRYGWLYLNTIVVLGQWYFEMDEPQKSLDCYQKVLAKEPDFKWAKKLLENQRKGGE